VQEWSLNALVFLALQCSRVAQAVLRNGRLRLKLKKQPLRPKEGNGNFSYRDSDVELSVSSNAFCIWSLVKLASPSYAAARTLPRS
jgi:hypothetical protein